MKKRIERRRRLRSKARAGFTLIEIMVVVMIIGMLMALVGVKVIDRWKKAQRITAGAQIKNLEQALNTYYMDNKNYPSTEQGLKALCEKPSSNPAPKNYPTGGYLSQATVPKDPWGNDYIYLSPGPNNTPYIIKSNGADGQEGGEGDNADIDSTNVGSP